MFLKSFDEASKEDIAKLVRKIEGRKLSEWTEHDYRTALKSSINGLKVAMNIRKRSSGSKLRLLETTM